jgi:DNA-binding MarR family transcriptional regulator
LALSGDRVLANLGKFGSMTARDICTLSHVEKTKVSRAVAALFSDGLLDRSPSTEDRRTEVLSLTPRGREVFADLGQRGLDYDTALRTRIGPEVAAGLDDLLRRIIAEGGLGDGD